MIIKKLEQVKGMGITKKNCFWILGLFFIFALLGIREYFDPYLFLHVDNMVRTKPAPLILELQEGVSFHLYRDTRPHIGKIAALQKGLVLVRNGEEVIEEGYGFGLPLIQYGDLVYLSRLADVEAPDDITLIKTYTISVADRWSKFLQKKYKDVEPLGTVVVTYIVLSPEELIVDVDFTDLTVDWNTAYLMNEQGAVHFPYYENSAGERQHGEQVGIWQATLDFGCWISKDEELRFCIETEPGRQRFIGRERYYQYNWARFYLLSWSGIDLKIEAPMDNYSYKVLVEKVDEP
jgi:hypothetical protein